MSKEEMIRFIKSLNGSLDIQFLESLSKVQLSSYAVHLKAIKMKVKPVPEALFLEHTGATSGGGRTAEA